MYFVVIPYRLSPDNFDLCRVSVFQLLHILNNPAQVRLRKTPNVPVPVFSRQEPSDVFLVERIWFLWFFSHKYPSFSDCAQTASFNC